MKVAYLGCGSWGFCLARLLANNGHDVTAWTIDTNVLRSIQEHAVHPAFPDVSLPENIKITDSIEESLSGCDVIVEGVTSTGIRSVFEKFKSWIPKGKPIVLTSKGIEEASGMLLSEVIIDVLGKEFKSSITVLSGPSHAEEVVRMLPTTVTCSGFDTELVEQVISMFSNSTFRVYPNYDVLGVEFGGAMKNIIAIACGISDGLGFGDNAKAALMTRGLHEIRKLAAVKGALAETLSGLSGMGDLCVTCMSNHSRNYRFGRMLADGLSLAEAKEEVGQVVEGAQCCRSAMKLANTHQISLPITQCTFDVIYNGFSPRDAVKALMERDVKEEHL